MPNHLGILLTYGDINGYKCKILIGPGAVLNHISAELCENHEVEVKPENRTATMANKSEESVESTMKPCIVSIGPYSESMNFVVTKLRYDVVLSEKWLHEHRAVIDCHTNNVEL